MNFSIQYDELFQGKIILEGQNGMNVPQWANKREANDLAPCRTGLETPEWETFRYISAAHLRNA